MDKKPDLMEIARKKRHLFLVQKLHDSKGLTRQEIAELGKMEAGQGITQSGQNLTQNGMAGDSTISTPKKGRQREKKQIFLKVFEKVTGNISEACEKAGIDRKTFYNWQLKDKVFAERAEAIREGLVDLAESKLLKLVEEGNPTAIIFMLKCLGKNRGYVERQEVLDVKAIDQMAGTVAEIMQKALKEHIKDEDLRKQILKNAREQIKKLVQENLKEPPRH